MRYPVLLTGLLLATATLAPSTLAQEPELREAQIEALLDRSEKNRAFTESSKPDAPVIALVGDLGGGSASDPEAIAREFVKTYGKVLDFPDGVQLGTDLPLLSKSTGESGTALAFAPAQDGVPYLAGAIRFTISPEGKLVGVAGRYKKVSGAAMGGLGAAGAVKRALAEARKERPGVLMTGDGEIRESLADTAEGGIEHRYEVEILVGTTREALRFVLGPNGEVRRAMKGGCSVTANLQPDYEGVTDPGVKAQVKELKSITPVKWYQSFTIRGPNFVSKSGYSDQASALKENGFRDDPYFVVPQSDLERLTGQKKITTGNPLFLEPTVYYHLMVAHDAAVSWGVNADYKTQIPFNVWSKSLLNNAGFMPTNWDFHFAFRNPLFDNRHPAMDPSVIYHEYAHYLHKVLKVTGQGGGSDEEEAEAAALAEGFADAVANCLLKDSKVMRIFYPGNERDALGEIATSKTYDDLAPLYIVDNNGKRVPRDGKTEYHDAGQLFSGVCWELRKAINDDVAVMKLICKAIRDTDPPHSLKRIAAAMVAADGGAHTDVLTKALQKRGLIGPPPPAPKVPTKRKKP